LKDRAAILEAFREASGIVPYRDEDEITAREFSAAVGCNQKTATDKLEQVVADGGATKRKARLKRTGREATVYRLIDETTEAIK